MAPIKVSVIIPVYNTEKYLKKCISSIIDQSYKNLEIIIIDDGSTDSSSLICEEFLRNDSRIVYKKIKNSGVSNARNVGIMTSTGDYLSFIDSDDYIGKDYVKNLVQVANNYECEIVVCGLTELKGDFESKISIYKDMKEDFKEITFPLNIEDYLLTFEFNSSCSQLISKKLISDNNIKFNTEIKYGEDMLFSFECYFNSKKTFYLKQYDYFYIRNDNSAMGKTDKKSIDKFYDDNFKTMQIIINKFKINDEYKKLLFIKTASVFNGISTSVVYNSKNYIETRKILLDKRKEYDEVFNNLDFKKINETKEKLVYFLLKNKLILLYYILKKIRKIN